MRKVYVPSPVITLFILLAANTPVFAMNSTKFAYVGDETGSAFSGAQQGLEEANLQGKFLGHEYALESFADADSLPANLEPFIAILVGADKNTLLAVRAAAPGHPVFNLVHDDNDLRQTCNDNLLHVIASRKMKEDAVAQWQSKHPGAKVDAQAWHGDFVKFAARDLNKRFKKNFGVAMDDYAWAGWAAVKMSSDAVARNNISKGADMLQFLRAELAFDGQKGLTMTFRETGQLRQLMLLVEDEKLLGEAPVRGVARDIDSLGIRSCDN